MCWPSIDLLWVTFQGHHFMTEKRPPRGIIHFLLFCLWGVTHFGLSRDGSKCFQGAKWIQILSKGPKDKPIFFQRGGQTYHRLPVKNKALLIYTANMLG